MSKIEWTDKTWNPVVGCSKKSEGCDNCYAEKMAVRLKSMKVKGYQHVIGDQYWTGETAFIESALEKPFKWKNPCRIFVCSMGDLFHPTVADSQLNSIFLTMVKADWHTYLLLTKRPERMLKFMSMGWRGQMKNVWVGVTVENQQVADERIPVLLKTPATIRFISVEPMLEYVDIGQYLPQYDYRTTYDYFQAYQKMKGESPTGKPDLIKPGIDWAICGGETGPVARPMTTAWAIDLRDQCQEAGVPFFFKKHGDWWMRKNKAHKNENRLLDGKFYEETPTAFLF